MNRLKEEGIALVITLLVMTLLLIMGAAFLSISSTETLISINERKRLQAFHLAEAGAEWAIAKLNLDGGYQGTEGEEEPLGLGAYMVEVSEVSVPPGEPDQRLITATGCVYDCGPPSSARAQVEVVVEEEVSPFQFAMLGMDFVNLDNRVVVDSYDSALGDYDPDTAGAEGHIHSNGNITLLTNNTVKGNAQAGGTVSCGNGSQIGDPPDPTPHPCGSVTELVPAVNFNVVDTSHTTPNDNSTGIFPAEAYDPSTHDLTVGPGETVTLYAGTYYFNEIAVESNATLDVTGPVTIYMTGKFNAQGGAEINASKIPTNLLIFSSGSGMNVIELDAGTGWFYGAVYLLNGEFDIDTSDWKFYGSVIAKEVDIDDDVEVHYDVALARAKFRPVAGTWRELFP